MVKRTTVTSGPTAAQVEHERRAGLLNTLLTTPHGDLNALYPVHKSMIDLDPVFYMHMAAWNHVHGDVRDHKEMFVSTLALSSFEGARDVACALLSTLPPHQVARVIDFIKGREIQRRVPKGTPVKGQKREFEVKTEKVGLFVNVPNTVKTEVRRYLRTREANTDQFDRAVLTARRSMKRLYAGLHIKPDDRAEAILFKKAPPPDSLAYAVKLIAAAKDTDDQIRIIKENRISYRVASSIIREMTPATTAALIQTMTPQEAINNLGSLKKQGALDKPELKTLIDAKLKSAKKDKRVSAYKAKVTCP